VQCKHGGTDVELLETISARQGLGATWLIKCPNECQSKTFPTSSRQGRIFEVNRMATLGMRCIGRGHSSAEKLFSIMGLPPPVSHKPWAEHSKAIEEKCRELCEDMNYAAWDLKKVLQTEGSIEDCSAEQLKEKVIDTGVTIDGSWCSRGWSATDACIATIHFL
jgi:hypothetical protein